MDRPDRLSCKKNKKTTYEGESRRDAFRQAKRDTDIPNNKKPSKVEPAIYLMRIMIKLLVQ